MAEPRPLSLRVLAIAGAVVVMLVGTVVLVPVLRELGRAPEHPPAAPMASPGPPIPAEADPYRLRLGDLAVNVDLEGRPEVHPRTLAFGERIRAYPGAPPRIPHGLTEEEFRRVLCNTCHARGGFSPRFGAYTPVTPHPELTSCLQCHVPDDRTVGIGIAPPTADGICLQCHVDPGAPAPSFVSLDWVPMDRPELGQRAMPGSPPAIPHRLHLRGNCLACHGGAAAVREIRTTHPERTDCRSCHVPIGEVVRPFTPPGAGFGPASGGLQ